MNILLKLFNATPCFFLQSPYRTIIVIEKTFLVLMKLKIQPEKQNIKKIKNVNEYIAQIEYKNIEFFFRKQKIILLLKLQQAKYCDKHIKQNINLAVHAQLLIHVQLFVTPWTVACQVPLPMGFSMQQYQSGLSFPFYH